ncbi:phage tail protein [Oceanobacillus profundus]|uniref:phage tail spike protein n=1 Tax=Oceanobacillus profundus TaxID=372463 RepID=UPI00203AA684|nr:phage tail spike protein [Oceanobacillus profundus]MCM3396493.1 phage tail protein [Oceanobacillus profundus]
MTELYIFSPNDEPLTIITEDTGLVSVPVRIEANSVPDTPFSFTVEADSENAEFVKDENKVVYRDHEGDLRLVVIKELDDSDSTDSPLTTAVCEPEFMELAETFVLDRRFTDRTTQFALDAALENTGWIGEVEVDLGLGSTNFYRTRVVDAIMDIIKTWGGEFKDVVEFNDENNIIARKIKVIQSLGKDHGQRFEIDHNITEIGRTVLSYPVTAMYGWGASLETEGGGHTRYIDFADVVWSKANGDPVDKPAGQMWVGDPEAFDKYKRFRGGKWIHRYGEFSNQDYEDPEELLWATWQNLQENKRPEVNYRLSVDLFDDKVSLGDTAIAIDRYFSRPIEIQARVIAMEYDLLDIEGTMIVEMGQFLNLDDDRLDEVINEVEKIRNRPSKVTENSYPDRKPSRPVNVTAVGGFEVIQLYWDYADELFIKHYEVYGSQVADFVPDSQHLLWRGQVSAFAHALNTDETWYYYVRAVNYHGTPSDWSARVSASTTRIISDDILFGEDLAARLRELNRISDIIGENGVNFEQISEEAKDLLNQQARIYTDEEIEAVESKLMSDISNLSDSLEFVNGQLVDKVNIGDVYTISEIDGMFSNTVSLTKYQTDMDGVVQNLNHHSTLFEQTERDINARVKQLVFDDFTESVESSITDLNIKADGVISTVNNVRIGGRNLIPNSRGDSLEGWRGWNSTEVRIVDGVIRVRAADSPSSYGAISPKFEVKAGKQYTLSLNIASNFRTSILDYMYILYYAHSNQRVNSVVMTAQHADLRRYSITFTANNTGTASILLGAYIKETDYLSEGFLLEKVQLENGSLDSPWQPNVDELDQRMTISESTITQLSREIDLKVDVDGVVSQINLNREGIRIKGNLIHLDGLTIIEDGIITNSHIKNLSADKITVGTMLGNRIDFNSLHGDKIIAGTLNADRMNVAYLSAINSNLGTVRAGRLLSNNNNMDLNLNTGNLTMRNANLTLGGGADVRFTDKGNRIFYTHGDPTNNRVRSSGIGVGQSLNDRFPFVYMGTTSTNSLNATDRDYFTGFIANTEARTNIDGIGNAVVGKVFHIRDKSVSFSQGIRFDMSSNTMVIHPMNFSIYNYHLGTPTGQFARAYLQDIRSDSGFIRFRNSASAFSNQGFTMETVYGSDNHLHFRGTHSDDYWNLGKPGWRFSYIYLNYQPNVSSDLRLKENIRYNTLGLDFINELETKTFQLINNNPRLDKEPVQYGIIAQQLRDTLVKYGVDYERTNMLSIGEDGMYGVQYTQLIAPTIKAVQELDQKLDNELNWLKTENQLQANEIKILKYKVQQLEELVA